MWVMANAVSRDTFSKIDFAVTGENGKPVGMEGVLQVRDPDMVYAAFDGAEMTYASVRVVIEAIALTEVLGSKAQNKATIVPLGLPCIQGPAEWVEFDVPKGLMDYRFPVPVASQRVGCLFIPPEEHEEGRPHTTAYIFICPSPGRALVLPLDMTFAVDGSLVEVSNASHPMMGEFVPYATAYAEIAAMLAMIKVKQMLSMTPAPSMEQQNIKRRRKTQPPLRSCAEITLPPGFVGVQARQTARSA